MHYLQIVLTFFCILYYFFLDVPEKDHAEDIYTYVSQEWWVTVASDRTWIWRIKRKTTLCTGVESKYKFFSISSADS